MLVGNLPPEGAFQKTLAVRALRQQKEQGSMSEPDPFKGIDDWPLSDQLLAHVVDLLAISNWQRGGGKSSKPKLMTQTAKQSKAPSSHIDVRAALAKLAPPPRPQEVKASNE